MRVSLSDEAQVDADAAIEWYVGEAAFTAVDDFADELDRAIALLIEFPNTGAPAGHDTRALPLHGFPYSLIYRVRTDAIRTAGRGIGPSGGRTGSTATAAVPDERYRLRFRAARHASVQQVMQ